ncbi:MAG: DUF1820 family protein [Gammaproteobacteria bacterium]|nr:DUF1820 family protein [Gammaproteobacteria bacterium]MCI0590720.1 DUF1820 family protein [Gammaproteobacteria bacterium]
MPKKPIYRVIFHNQGKIYEVYARYARQGDLFGFVEIEQLVFGDKASVVVDPSEENLKSEFKGVTRTYIPMHSVIRIDEVEKERAGKITQVTEDGKIVAPFPIYTKNSELSKK